MTQQTERPLRDRRPRTGPKGRGVDRGERARVAALLGVGATEPPRDLLIECLHRLQDADGGLRRPALVALADLMRLPMAEVYEVASFYHHFDLLDDDAPAPAAVTVRVCDSIACQMAGADALHAELAASAPAGVRVLRAPCIGRCAEAPAVCVGQNAFGPATPAAVADALREGRTHAEPPEALGDGRAYARYRESGGYGLLAALAAADDQGTEAATATRERVFGALESANLRGLGGAGFPAGRKWRIVAAEPAPRLLVVNIDEGEPGTFKDRHYLERDPHRFLEGMLVAAWAVRAESCWIYLRDEYHALRHALEQEIASLASDPPAPGLPRIVLRRGAGAYICGEESALIESLEGKRGMPRLRPPYVAQVGLFGRPALAHNLETLWWVRDILKRGDAAFGAHGRHGRKGLRSFSVSGRVRSPGVKLAPAGITLAELVDEHCGGMLPGHALYAYLPGGASGGILPARLAHLPLDFDTLAEHGCFIGSAAVVVLSQQDRAVDAARNLMRFFRDESCGQCTPCRSGTAKAVALMDAPHWDRGLLDELCTVMADASICGLGQAAPNPIRCVMRYFAHELEGGTP